jgi:hypothetical protein
MDDAAKIDTYINFNAGVEEECFLRWMLEWCVTIKLKNSPIILHRVEKDGGIELFVIAM